MKRIVVLGGGPAGVAAAVSAARSGSKVTLISEEPVGGRAAHSSMLPSKVWLHRAALRASGRTTDQPLRLEVDRVHAAYTERMRLRLEDAGVRVVRGRARILDHDTLECIREADARREPYDALVVAVGSVPVFPDGFFGGASGPDGTRVIAPRHLRTMSGAPSSVVVVGGGASGAEAVHACSALGAREVTWVLDELGILPDFDRELADSLGDVLMERGVKIVHGKRVLRALATSEGARVELSGGHSYRADVALVAVGRRADTEPLGLSAIGLVTDPESGAISVDANMRTAVPHVFAAGDAAGKPFLASKAEIEGSIAGAAASLPIGTPSEAQEAAPGPYIETVYTEPEVAMVGATSFRARAAGRDIEIRTVMLSETMRGILDGIEADRHARGIVRVVLDAGSRQVIGATAIGPRAADILAPIAVAIRGRLSVYDLGAAGLASPTYTEVSSVAGR